MLLGTLQKVRIFIFWFLFLPLLIVTNQKENIYFLMCMLKVKKKKKNIPFQKLSRKNLVLSMEHTPFFLNGLLESNCLIICFRSPRLGSSKSFLAASCFDMFTSMEATCSNGSSGRYAMKISDQHCGVKKGKFKFANQNNTK